MRQMKKKEGRESGKKWQKVLKVFAPPTRPEKTCHLCVGKEEEEEEKGEEEEQEEEKEEEEEEEEEKEEEEK